MPEQAKGNHGQNWAAFIGLDVGGTSSKIGWLSNEGGELKAFRSFPTGARRNRGQVMQDLLNAVLELRSAAQREGRTVVGVGVGLPAALSKEGRIEVLPNFAPGWHGVAVAEELEAKSGIPTRALNDARAFTLAEALYGAAAGVDSALGVTLGTGVGGGLVLDGKLYLGPSGKAGEFGHHVVDRNGPLCGCGSHGCLETYASATALVASVLRPLLQGAAPRLTALTGGHSEAVTPQLIGQAAREGDEACQEALSNVAKTLGVAIANVTTLLGVERVVIGGGMAGLGDQLLEPLKRTLASYALVVGDDLPDVVPASLGGRAGALGAALAARETFGFSSSASY